MSLPASTIPGLDAARCAAEAPVIGIGEAAFHMATLVAGRFRVVTTLARSVPAIEHNLVRNTVWRRDAHGSGHRTSPCSTSKCPAPTPAASISAEIGRAISDDKAEAIVLGCAGMADLADELSREHGVPVLDGVACAVRLAETVSALGLRTSKVGGYAWPRPKRFAGIYAAFSPEARNNASAGLTAKQAL